MPDTEITEASARELTYRVIAMPADTNAAGDIFGGWLMSQIDIAGSVPAVHASSGRVATVAVKELRFLAPIKVGDLVSFYAQIIDIGRTSLTVHVEAEAARNRSDQLHDQHIVADARLVYVALDDQGKPRPVSAS